MHKKKPKIVPLKDAEKFMAAAMANDVATLEQLTKKYADIFKDKDQQLLTGTFTRAVWAGKKESAAFLLDFGVPVDTRNIFMDDGTALITAAKKDKGELVRLLMQKGANPDLKDENGKRAEVAALGNPNAWGALDHELKIIIREELRLRRPLRLPSPLRLPKPGEKP
jgi:ankyrin repeat protein